MNYNYLTWQRDDLKLNCAHFVVSPTLIEPLHGHTYSIKIEAEGTRNASSVIVDFLDLKPIVKDLIDQYNFTLLIPQNNPFLSIKLNETGVSVTVLPTGKKYSFPKRSVSILPTENSTVECISTYFTEIISKRIKEIYPNLTKLKVSVGEYSKSVATAVELF